MSIYGAMYSGVSGLTAQSSALAMISDNISNSTTVGYKRTSASFSTLVTDSANNSLYTPGGVKAIPQQHVEQQGLLTSSTAATDLAIAGNGFFVVHDTVEPVERSTFLFTRAGGFRQDADGNLKNGAGYYLQGWPLDPQTGKTKGNTSVLSSLETINIANLSGTARATSNIDLSVNLPSVANVGDKKDVAIQIFDALGNAHDLTVTWEKTATNNWKYTINQPKLSESGAVSGTVVAGTETGTVTFDGKGVPSGPDTNNDGKIDTPDIKIQWTVGGAADSQIAFNIGQIGKSDGVTQFAGNFSINAINQDGVRFGNFTEIVINDEGIVTALFDNGERQDIYKIPVAMFENVNGLETRDGNAYIMTSQSGDLTLVGAQEAGSGRISSGALEASTVDLADEFTNMIVTQRAYSASSKVITTADEMLEELIRIK